MAVPGFCFRQNRVLSRIMVKAKCHNADDISIKTLSLQISHGNNLLWTLTDVGTHNLTFLHHQPTFAFVTEGQSFKKKNEQTYKRRTYISIFLGNCIIFGATAAEGYNSVGVRFVAVWSAPLHARKKNQLEGHCWTWGHQNVKNVLPT